MAISFVCEHCDRHIEVDDEAAGQFADCPYCRRVVPVPKGGPSLAANRAVAFNHSATTATTRETVTTSVQPHFGKVALASIVIAQLCFFVAMFLQFSDFQEMSAADGVEITQIDRGITYHLLFFGAFGGGSTAVFAGIMSLTRKEKPRWPAITALCMATLFVCGFTLLTTISMMFAGFR